MLVPDGPPTPVAAQPMAPAPLMGVPGPFPGPASGPSAPPIGWPPAPSTNGLAVASLVLGIVPAFGITSILGIVFGFVARGQIARSRGRQKGAGMALAGIIAGFAWVALILLAIAIPTFLGVSQSNGAVERLPAQPIPVGAPTAGGPAGTIDWVDQTLPVDTSLTALPDGVTMSIASTGHVEDPLVPVATPATPAMVLRADVTMVDGPTGDGIGLGCSPPDDNANLAFMVHGTGLWEVLYFPGDGEQLVDSGVSPAIRPTGVNSVTISCAPAPGDPGATALAFEVNGTPLLHDVVRIPTSAWVPVLQMCSCAGPDVGAFANVTYYAASAS